MLTRKSIKDPKAVETNFCIPFSKLQQQPMSKNTSSMFTKLYLASRGGNVDIPEKEKPFILQMAERALKTRFSFEIEQFSLIAFIAFHSESPGKVIMYFTYLQYECKNRNRKVLDWDLFADIFANGFPSDQDLSRLWSNTKVPRDKVTGGSDNLIDYQSAMQSIHFEEVLN